MRVQHWLVPILGALTLLAAGQTGRAQVFPGHDHETAGPGYPVPPLTASYAEGESAWAAGGNPAFGPPATAGVAPQMAAYPQEFQPWPTISPYDNNFSRYQTDGGLWQSIFNNEQREYKASFEWLVNTKTRGFQGLVGFPGAITFAEKMYPIVTDDDIGMDLDPAYVSQFIGDARDLSTAGIRFGLDGGSTQTQILGFIAGGTFPGLGLRALNWFGPVQQDLAFDAPQSRGLRLKLGFEDADDSGVKFEAWWSGRANEFFDAGNRRTYYGGVSRPSLISEAIDTRDNLFIPTIPILFAGTGTGGTLNILAQPYGPEIELQRSLLNAAGLPLNDGTFELRPDGTTLGGTTVPFDLKFQIKQTSQSAGTGIDFVQSPLIKKGPFRMRALWGGRYVLVDETFRFDGEDSGLSYDNLDVGDPFYPTVKLVSVPNFFDDDGDGIVDNTGLIEDPNAAGGGGGGGGGGQMVRFVRNDILAEQAGVFHPGHYSAFLQNSAMSHMVGPEVGLSYDVGGDAFRLVGHSKFGLMLNLERIELNGNNIGDANNIGQGIDLTETPPSLGGTDDLLFDDDPLAFIQDSPLLEPTLANPNPNAFSQTVGTTTHVSPLFEQSIGMELQLFRYVPVLRRVHLLEEGTFSVGYTITWIGEVARPGSSIVWQGNPRAGIFPIIDRQRGSWWMSNINLGINFPY